MNRKKTAARIAALVFALLMALSFAGCGGDSGKDKNKETTQPYTNEDGKTQVELNSDDENFYGKWVATSDTAEYLYGNLEITINEDGTFDANVTDELFSGTWEKIDGGISFDSIYITGKMFFGKKCKMVIYEEDIAPITLQKQE